MSVSISYLIRNLASLIALCALTVSVSAATINFCGGDAAFTPTGNSDILPGEIGSITSSPGNFQCKSQSTPGGVVAGVGVSGGNTGNEIDPGEEITFDFPALEFVEGYAINSLMLGFAFNGPEYADPQEKGVISFTPADGGPDGYIEFQVTGEDLMVAVAFANLPGLPGTISPCFAQTTLSGGGGCFVLNDPFGGAIVSSVKFGAVSVTPRPASNDSDYVLSSIDLIPIPRQTEEIPEPSTYALMALGLVGLGLLRKRSKV